MDRWNRLSYYLPDPQRRSWGSVAVHSFHLFPIGLPSVASVALMVEILPSVEHGYFWAMQVDWDDGSGAHLGLQWWPGYPGNRAVNWGGYSPAGAELYGTESELPSSLQNPNTRDFSWNQGEWYTLEVDADGTGRVDGRVVRRLEVGSRRVVRVGVWTEMFAPCSSPRSQVRWRGITGRVQCSYEPTCGNTCSWREGDDLVQATGLSGRPFRRPVRRRAFL